MKNSLQKYIGWGITVVIVGALTMLIFFGFYKFSVLARGVGKVISIMMPIIIGVVIAYVLSPAYNWMRRRLRRLLRKTFHWRGRKSLRCADILAMTATFAAAGAVIAGLLALILPQLLVSISSIATSLPSNLLGLSRSLQSLLASNPQLETSAMSLYAQAVIYMEQWIEKSLTPSIQDALSYVSIGVVSTVTFFKNFIIGIIVAIYLMSGKERFLRQGTRCLYAIFGARWGNILMEQARYAHQVFSGFIGGKLLDSFLIFLICCVVLPIMGMPYAMLISVIIGVTNVIPFFGPFIGAVPAFIIVLIDNPMKALYFLIFVLILQQFDGNILGPKILGDSTGLSSFWVLFAILLFGGLFGFVGMLIGVPVFAVIYHILTDLIAMALQNKNLPVSSDSYILLNHIDEDSRKPIRRDIKSSDLGLSSGETHVPPEEQGN